MKRRWARVKGELFFIALLTIVLNVLSSFFSGTSYLLTFTSYSLMATRWPPTIQIWINFTDSFSFFSAVRTCFNGSTVRFILIDHPARTNSHARVLVSRLDSSKSKGLSCRWGNREEREECFLRTGNSERGMFANPLTALQITQYLPLAWIYYGLVLACL